MKRTFYLLFLILIIFYSCTSKQTPEFIPQAYYYPIDSLNTERIFSYIKAGTANENFIAIKLISNSNGYLISKRQYTNSVIIDSTIIDKNDKLAEIYVFGIVDSSMSKGEIVQDTILSNSTKNRIRERLRVYKGIEFIYIMYSKEEYTSDTVISWGNKMIDCIKISAISKNTIVNTKDTSQKTSFISSHNFYYGKNIGLLRYTTELDSASYMFTLKDIKRE